MGLFTQQIPRNPVCRRSAFGSILNYDHSGRSLSVLRRRGDLHNEVRRVSVLSELAVGESGILVALDLPENVQNHMMHMGFVQDAHVTALRRAPAGDPTVYGIDGMEIALRRETAAAIRVRFVDAAVQPSLESSTSAEAAQLAEAAQ